MACAALGNLLLPRLSRNSTSHSSPVNRSGISDVSFSRSQVRNKWPVNLHAKRRQSSTVFVVEDGISIRRKKQGRAVRCAAEGIEGEVFVGRREGGFVAAERFKVVALVAAVMCLCNADRVVMSVAIVPLASKYGWSSSFLGIVQVPLFFFLFSGKLNKDLNYYLFIIHEYMYRKIQFLSLSLSLELMGPMNS